METSKICHYKARGKTVIAVRCDDRYFHVANRMIRLEYGQVGESWPESRQEELIHPEKNLGIWGKELSEMQFSEIIEQKSGRTRRRT
ncbi:MAG TPA: hypothetical protein ENK58_09985, partial [Desulfobacterales bacterium]|nr:hypothetical protein [Desulfobacterales bacterium]